MVNPNEAAMQSATKPLRARWTRAVATVAVAGLALTSAACRGGEPTADRGAVGSGSTTTAQPSATQPPVTQPSVVPTSVPTSAVAAESISVLYSLTAVAGSLIPVPGTTGDYVLELTGTDRHTVWFSDRPKRTSGTLATAELVAQWTALGMAVIPPNVALVVHDAPGEADTLVAVLRDPHFDAATGRFRATITVLADENRSTGGASDHFSVLADGMLPANFEAVSMFIDDMAATVTDGCLVTPASTCPPR